MPKKMSLKQVEANRRNAQKSTGPRTEQGKASSKMNALKHGVLAQTVVVRGQKLRESTNEFKRLCREFYASLAPAGPLEEMLVDQIIQASWRLRRARTAESGEIALSVDGGHWQRQKVHPRQQWMLWEVWGDPVCEMESSSMGGSILVDWLGEVRARVEQEGELSDEAIKIPFHGKPNRLAEELEQWRQASPPSDASGEQREQAKAKLLAHLDRKLGMLRWQQEKCAEHERAEEQARQAAAVLPAGATMDKIMRYETALERQLYRAMNQLERLQRRRQGENIPAPLTMEISTKA